MEKDREVFSFKDFKMPEFKKSSITNERQSVIKQFVDEIIRRFGVSKSINEIALSVQCIGDAGKKFELVQFHNNRGVVHVLGG